MNHPPQRYLVGLIAFIATVTLFTEGIGITIAGLAACGAVVYGDRLLALRERRPRPVRLRARPLTAERDHYQLVPDEPSLILSPEL